MKRPLIILLSIIGVWAVWCKLGRNEPWTESESAIEQVQQIKRDSLCTKHIVAIQPYMVTTDYRSEKHFYQKLKTYFEQAKQNGLLHENTVVLLPEYLGTWLVIVHEKKSVAEASTITKAMAIMVASNPIQFLKSLFIHNGEEDAFTAAIFRMKAQTMAHVYTKVMKQLAKEFQVTINSGSIVLPGPTVRGDSIYIRKYRSLYNTSFVFSPSGKIEKNIVKKSFPIGSELPFIEPSPIEQLNSFDLPIGKTSVLVCADSWYPQSYTQLNKQKPEVLLVGSFCSTNQAMGKLWKGYDGSEVPADIDQNDIGKITEQEAWIKYAMPGRIKHIGAKVGVTIFLHGKLWDLGSDGYPLIVMDGNLVNVNRTERAGMYTICF